MRASARSQNFASRRGGCCGGHRAVRAGLEQGAVLRNVVRVRVDGRCHNVDEAVREEVRWVEAAVRRAE